jgi:hypothetical protein
LVCLYKHTPTPVLLIMAFETEDKNMWGRNRASIDESSDEQGKF